jgi:hypothetical protein
MTAAIAAAPWILAAYVAVIILGAWRRDHMRHPRVRKAGHRRHRAT